MSRYRNIQCSIWYDNKFPFMSDDAQLVWFHAFTYPHSTALGIYMASIEALASNKRWTVKRYTKGFMECLDKRLLEYDEKFHVVYFPKYFEHNRPSNPNVFRGWLKCWGDIPRCKLKELCFQALTEAVKRWGKPYMEPLANVQERFGVSLAEQEQEQEQEQERKDMSGKPDPATLNGKELKKTANSILTLLNEKANRAYPANDTNLGLIVARLKENYTETQLRQVTVKKCREWLGDEKMTEYLRPKTLYGKTNMAQYVGELVAPT